MPYTLESFVIDVFTGINDNPIPPNPTRAGNGSHVVSKFNGLINFLTQVINIIDAKVNKNIAWKPITQNYVASIGDRIVLYGGGTIVVQLPPAQDISSGDTISLIKADERVQVKIDSSNVYILGNSYSNIFIDTLGEPIYLIYLGEGTGWICSKMSALLLDGNRVDFNPYG